MKRSEEWKEKRKIIFKRIGNIGIAKPSGNIKNREKNQIKRLKKLEKHFIISSEKLDNLQQNQVAKK